MKKAISLVLLAAMLLGLLAGCGGGGEQAGGDEATSFEWWMNVGENTQYYAAYEDNPVLQYIMQYKTFENEAGEQVNIDFTFQVPAVGKEVDSFNTMIATGTYPEIINNFAGNAIEMYEGGLILDLTDYVNQYMPNYLAYIEAHPELRAHYVTEVDGEEKFLGLIGSIEALNAYDQFYGWCYRRDWLVKYGTQPESFFDPMVDSAPRANPNAGKGFTGAYTLDNSGNAISSVELTDEVNGDSWVDDVVFPSGGPDPVYISDWEWMMEIFETARAAEGITEGYMLSLFYPGYLAVGDLVTGFGGIGPVEYRDVETNTIYYGGVSDEFKAYLECMHAWYQRGWIDKRFAERSGDSFFSIDDATVRQGKVAMWLGSSSTLGSRIVSADHPSTQGAVVYGARNPINDVYGDDSAKLKYPNHIFQNELVGGQICVTEKAKDKDIKVFCEFIDYLYSEEGAVLKSFGLSKEQMAQCQNETYLKYGLTEGAYTTVEVDGETRYQYVPLLEADDGGVRGAMTLNRVTGLSVVNRAVHPDTPTYLHSRDQWVYYESTAFINQAIKLQLSPEDSSEIQKLKTRVENEYMFIAIPQFIRGELDLDADWDTYLADVKKRNYQKVIDLYQAATDACYGG